jgi:hypothetical protein
MSLETENREPSRRPSGERCRAPSSNSHEAGRHLGGVSEGDRTGRADRVGRENSGGASATQRAVPGGHPTEPASAAGVVRVPRSSVDPSESITEGEPRRGTWAHGRGHSEGAEDGRATVATLFDRITTPPKNPEAGTRPLPQSQGGTGLPVLQPLRRTAAARAHREGRSPRTPRPASAADLGGLDTGRGVEAQRVNGPRKAGCGKTARPV